MATHWHALEGTGAAELLGVDPAHGLGAEELETRRAEHGRNALPRPPRKHPVVQLLSQLADPLVGALLVAAVVAVFVASGERSEEPFLLRFSDPIAILLIVVLNALLGFFQERKAEAALDALEKMAAPRARALRTGLVVEIDAAELVPGDVVVIEAGDAIPADLRLLESVDLATVEAALTGESTQVAKDAAEILEERASLAERTNMVFTGTNVSRGRGRGVVVATGGKTEIGRIGALIRATDRPPTPLEEHLAWFGKLILLVCLLLSGLLFVVGLVQGTGSWSTLLLTAVSLAVAAIPEGLPAITTITLGLGMLRMAERGAIVRKLAAVETLGSATVICSDKTGTLTQNAMVVRHLDLVDAELEVTGEGYRSEGTITAHGEPVDLSSPQITRLLRVAAVCNTAHLREEEGEVRVIGDPTEGALLALAAKGGVVRESPMSRATLVEELPFSSDRKRMSMVVEDPDATRVALVKGSLDVLLERCTHALTASGEVPLTDELRATLHARADLHADEALRVLAFADRRDPENDPEQGLVLLGWVAMLDPPRPGVKEAVAACRSAGMRVVMVTGDHRRTAVAIARELGFWEEGAIAVTGAELAEMDDAALDGVVPRAAVFARVTAAQKLRIVEAFERAGHVVSVTGDGVNDAPALRRASIGVAMGLGGTDVAREASDMVLADDNFATIVHAVREGRAIFRNIQKFIFFLNSSNAGLVFAVIVGSFFDWMLPLLPIQLLWINLVTNGLPALALGVDPPQEAQMREAPRRLGSGIMDLRDLAGILLVGVVMGGAALALYLLPDRAPGLFLGQDREEAMGAARTMAFTLLALSPLFHAHNCRSPRESVLTLGLFTNRALWGAIVLSAAVHLATFVPALRPVFHTVPLSGAQWGVVLGLSVLPLPVVELLKALDRRLRPRTSAATASGS